MNWEEGSLGLWVTNLEVSVKTSEAPVEWRVNRRPICTGWGTQTRKKFLYANIYVSQPLTIFQSREMKTNICSPPIFGDYMKTYIWAYRLAERQKSQLFEKLRDLIMLYVTSPNITCLVVLLLITDDTHEINNSMLQVQNIHWVRQIVFGDASHVRNTQQLLYIHENQSRGPGKI